LVGGGMHSNPHQLTFRRNPLSRWEPWLVEHVHHLSVSQLLELPILSNELICEPYLI
jgi:hypothetical protein